MPHTCVSELRLVACSAPSHYQNQCWDFIKWTFRNKIQWNFNQNTKLFIHENASENIVCEMAAILSGGVGGYRVKYGVWILIQMPLTNCNMSNSQRVPLSTRVEFGNMWAFPDSKVHVANMGSTWVPANESCYQCCFGWWNVTEHVTSHYLTH